MKSRKILALEMRDSELLALEATRTPTSIKVTNFGRFNLSGAVAGNDLGNALKTLLRAHGFSGKSVALVLPNDLVEHRLLDLPPVAGAKLAAIARGQSLKDTQLLSVGDVDCRFIVREEVKEKGDTRKRVFSTNFALGELRKRLLVVSEAGLEPLFSTSPVAALSELGVACSQGLADSCRAILYIREHELHIIVFDHKGWLFSRELALMRGSFDDTPVMSHTEDAAGSENDFSDIDDKSPAGADTDSIADVAIEEINRSFLFFKQNSRRMIDEILLVSEDEQTKQIKLRIEKDLGISVRLLQVAELVDFSDLSHRVTQEAFAVNLYLPLIALASATDSEKCPNLIPEDFLERRTMVATKGIFAAVGFALLCATVAGYAALAYNERGLERLLSKKQESLAGRQSRFKDMETLMAKQALYEKKDLILKQSLVAQPPWDRILKWIGQITPADLSLTQLSIQRKSDGCRLSVSGEALAANAYDAQASFRAFCDAWNGCPFFSESVLEPVKLQIVEATPEADNSANGTSAASGMRHKVLFSMTAKVGGNR
ncbi:hypothetical protein HZA56_21350 [Candidatus Poribacteria bacterium]|nr:hypothetical protein [Candidatus Poribacteria bacterium]